MKVKRYKDLISTCYDFIHVVLAVGFDIYAN